MKTQMMKAHDSNNGILPLEKNTTTAGSRRYNGWQSLMATVVFGMTALFGAVNAYAQSGNWSSYATSLPSEVNNTYTITTSGQLAAFANAVNNGNTFAGKTIVLANDLDMSAHYWTPAGDNGSTSRRLMGTFNGNDRTITGIKMNPMVYTQYAGFFGYIGTNGKAQNLNLEKAYIIGFTGDTAYAGGIAGYNCGHIVNCEVDGVVNGIGLSLPFYPTDWKDALAMGISAISNFSLNLPDFVFSYAGGIVGYNNGGIISNSTNRSRVNAIAYTTLASAGGVVGLNENGMIVDCRNHGKVRALSTDIIFDLYDEIHWAISVGKTAGLIDGILIDELLSKGVEKLVEKIFGEATKKAFGKLPSVTVKGIANIAYAGGIAGMNVTTNGNGGIIRCSNSGTVDCDATTMSSISEIVGLIKGIAAVATTGLAGLTQIPIVISVIFVDSYSGGVAGWNNGIIDDCHSRGGADAYCFNLDFTSIVAGVALPSYAGGMVGHNVNGTIRNCTNSGEMNGKSANGILTPFSGGNITAHAGGLSGKNSGGDIENSSNSGKVRAYSFSASLGSSYTYARGGGVAGIQSGNGKIVNCYSRGAVFADWFNATISFWVYFSAGSFSEAGGLVGENKKNCIVANSYWLSDGTSGRNRNAFGKNNGTRSSVSHFTTAPGTLAANSVYGTKDLRVSLDTWASQRSGYSPWSAVWGMEGGYPFLSQPVSVTFNSNGGVQSSQTGTQAYGRSYTLPDEPEREGYDFADWWTVPGTTGGMQVYSNTTVTANGTHTLYARWTAKSYTLEFDVNDVVYGPGGMVSPTNMTVTFDERYDKWGNFPEPPAISRTGYTFNGWFPTASGGIAFNPATKITTDPPTIPNLYAQWTPITYTVQYNGNGHTGGSTVSTSHIYDVAAALRMNGFTKTGYSFAWWATTVNSTNGFNGGESVANLTATPNGTVTLFAQWTPNSYTVTFNYQGGTGSLSTEVVTFDSSYGDLPEPKRDGYTFKGWFTTAEEDGTRVLSSTKIETASDHTLYAQWTDEPFAVTFIFHGGRVLEEDGSVDNDASMIVEFGKRYDTLPVPTRTGYTTNGWWTAETGGTQVFSNSMVTTADNQVLHARWTANTYTVQYNNNGGSGSMANTTHTYDVWAALRANTFTRNGYTFDRWLDVNGPAVYPDEQNIINLRDTSGTVILYAQWKVNTDYWDNRMPEKLNGKYTITTAGQLAAFRDLVNGGTHFNGELIELGASFSIPAGTNWDPIGNYTTTARLFRGAFDGKGYTISGLTINNTPSRQYAGLFGHIGTNGKVQNVNLTDVSISADFNGTMYVGGVAGGNDGGSNGGIFNCSVSGTVSGTASGSASTACVGGVVGYNASSSRVEGCVKISGSVSASSASDSIAGGVVGYNLGITRNSSNSGTVTANSPTSGWAYAGGITGVNDPTGTIQNCLNSGSVTGTTSATRLSLTGGVVGENRGAVSNCTNNGVISSSSQSQLGGVVGRNTGTVAYCMNNEKVSVSAAGAPKGGGIVGVNVGTVSNSRNTVAGTVHISVVSGSHYLYAGGIVGCNEGVVSSCSNDGSVTANAPAGQSHWAIAGGVVGANGGNDDSYAPGGAIIRNCSNSGSVQSSSRGKWCWAGGVAGYNRKSDMKNCMNSGTVATTGDGRRTGGVTATNDGGLLENCINRGAVTGASGNSGGIVGRHKRSGAIKYSYWHNSTAIGVHDRDFNCSEDTVRSFRDSLGILYSVDLYPPPYLGTPTIYITSGNTVSGVTISPYAATTVLLTALNNWRNANGSATYSSWTTNSNVNGGYPFLQNSHFTVFDGNGGVQATPVIQVLPQTPGAAYTVPTAPTRTGYTRMGGANVWYTTATSGTAVTVTSTTTVPNAPHTILYARWTANTNTVTFDRNSPNLPNANAPSMTSKTVTYDGTYGTLATVSRTGHVFDGWWTLDGTSTGNWGTQIITTTKVDITANQTLFAKWLPQTYMVEFEDENRAVSPSSKTVMCGSAYGTLPMPSRPGYSFSGWFTAATGGTQVTASSTVTTATVLYAQWTANNYHVILDCIGGTVDQQKQLGKQVTYNSTYGTLPTPIRAGYTFQDWFTDATIGTQVTNATPVSVPTDLATTRSPILYARWTVNNYTVTFNYQGGTVSPAQPNKSVTFDAIYGTLPEPTRVGYTFSGWNTAANGSGVMVGDSTKVFTNADHILYAQWTANIHTVIFVANYSGGVVSPNNKKVAFGSEYGALPTPLRPGYTFKGWFTMPTDGTQVAISTTVATDANHDLFAQWTANTYTVIFNANYSGGTVSPSTKTVTFDSPYGVLPEPERMGYDFKGWFTAATGGALVTATTTNKVTFDHTLYAQWGVRKITVTFDVNDANYEGSGRVSPSSKVVTFDSTYGALPTPTRPSHLFNGWFTDPVDTNGLVTAATEVAETFTETLYAQWTQVCVVTFLGVGAEISTAEFIVKYGSPYGEDIYGEARELPVPEREGYSFVGWFTEVSGGTQVDASMLVFSDHALYTRWEEDTPRDNWAHEDNRDQDWIWSATPNFTNFIGKAEELAQFAWLVNQGTNFVGCTIILTNDLVATMHREVFTNALDVIAYTENLTSPYTGYGVAEWTNITYEVAGDVTNVIEEVNYAVTVTNDFSMKRYYWTPAGTNSTCAFRGTFDGQGHVIQGITIDDVDSLQYAGFFGYVGSSGTVQDVNLADTLILVAYSGAVYAGSVAGYNDGGFIERCSNKGAISVFSDDKAYVGGVVGYNSGNKTTLADCVSVGLVEAFSFSEAYVGGVIGLNAGNGNVIERNLNFAEVFSFSCSSSSGSGSSAGGVVGYNSNGSTIDGCSNDGFVSAAAVTYFAAYIGGIAGDNLGVIRNCQNSGAVTAFDDSDPNYYAGGVAGRNSGVGSAIWNCLNSGEVSASFYVGGLVGWNNSTIENCHNRGEVNASSVAYGIGGLVGWHDSGKVSNCYWKKDGTDGLVHNEIGHNQNGITEDIRTFTDAPGTFTNSVTVNGTATTSLLMAPNAWVTAKATSGDMSYSDWTLVGSPDGYPVLACFDYYVRVILDAQGGTVSPLGMNAVIGQPYDLPVPERKGFEFEGWFTEPDGEGTRVDENTIAEALDDDSVLILYAKWTQTHTLTTPVLVPYSWLDQWKNVIADYEDFAESEGANGVTLWESYVAGLIPTNATSRFLITNFVVKCDNGKDAVATLDWTPRRADRVYTVWGKTNLMDTTPWYTPTNSASRFFKVEVKLLPE